MAADQLGARNHVRVGHAPRDLAVRLQRERLDLACNSTCGRRDEPRIATIGAAERWLQRSAPVRASNA